MESAAARELRDLGVETVAGDLTDARGRRARRSTGCDVAYHIAATYREAGQPDSAYRAINVDGTRHVLEGAKAAGVRRVVHCSTGGVHGHIEHPPANEDAPFGPGDIYQETKLEAETLAREFGRTQGLEVSVVRPIGIYGPRDFRFLKMFRGIARGRFPILGGGEVFYHLTFVSDLVQGFRLAADTPAAAGRTYIIGGPEYTTLNELAARIARVLGVRAAVDPPAGVALLAGRRDVRGGVHSAARRAAALPPARGLLHEEPRVRHHARAHRTGYEPQVSLDEGLRTTAAWYRERNLL